MNPTSVPHAKMANALRALAMDAVQKANSGHPGMPMGMADVATVLYTKFLKFDPAHPNWPDRDRFILSAGHGSMLLYALNYLTGYEKMTLDQIKNFRQIGSLTPGHPEVMHDAGIEMTTGPLGQGISTAVGFALAERLMNARFGNDIVGHHTFVIASDGDLMEGISHEACSLAGHLGLAGLIGLYGDNSISIDGSTALSFSDNSIRRFQAYGWNTATVDGHNQDEIARAIEAAQGSKDKPTLIACKTKIGYGAPTKAGTSGCHGSPLGDEEIAGARKALDWPHAPFEIPADVLESWRAAGCRHQGERKAWQSRLDALAADKKDAWGKAMSCDIAKTLGAVINDFKTKQSDEMPKIATRQSSGKVLEALIPAIPEMIGGSADLTGSNLTLVKDMGAVKKGAYTGRYVYYGVREHGMAAIMNGMSLHGGIIPYSGTFLSFADYCRPAIRLAALMRTRAIHVMTHDSIGLGEDGPTHQPVEHLAALRAIPNVTVLRPADVIETAECWQIALENATGPSVMALTRQALPTLRAIHTADNLCRKGAYILQEANSPLKVTIFASGSEVEIAVKAKAELEKKSIGTRVVSVPSFELFEKQDDSHRKNILGNTSIKVGVEAAVRMGWDRLIGSDGIFVGMKGFGESGPYQELYKHFGITAEAIVEAVAKKI